MPESCKRVNPGNDVSDRSMLNLEQTSPLFSYWLQSSLNAFDPVLNPNGIINLGTSENLLMRDFISDRLASVNLRDFPKELMCYVDSGGMKEFRSSIANFVSMYTGSSEQLKEEEFLVLNGACSVLEALAMTLCNDGDVIAVPAPYYGGFAADFCYRARLNILPLQRSLRNRNVVKWDQEIGEILQYCEKNEVCLKAIVLCNPDNPTGLCFEPADIDQILDFAVENNIHLVVDEIYMMSLLRKSAWTSFLGRAKAKHYRYLHWVWSFSKDFGLSGFRCGVVHTRNALVRAVVKQHAYWYAVPSLVQWMLKEALMDNAWIQNTYLPTYHLRLKASCRYLEDWCVVHGLDMIPVDGGLFAYIDMCSLVKEPSHEEEITLFKEFLERGVYVIPGSFCGHGETCWFRVLFSVDKNHLNLALTKMSVVVDRRRKALESVAKSPMLPACLHAR